MTNEEKRAKGGRAKNLLENELLIEAYEIQEKTLINAWKDDRNSKEEREVLWNLYQGVLGAQEFLRKVLITGNDAAKEIQRQLQK